MSKWNWREHIDADEDSDYAAPTPRGKQCRPDADDDDLMGNNRRNDRNFHDAMDDEGINRGLGKLLYYTYRNRLHDYTHEPDCDNSYEGLREYLRELKELLGWPHK